MTLPKLGVLDSDALLFGGSRLISKISRAFAARGKGCATAANDCVPDTIRSHGQNRLPHVGAVMQ
jgi:hypothetical protein